MRQNNLKGAVFLLLCAFFWGMAFSAQSDAMHYVGPYTFIFLRSAITSVVLFACLPLLRKLNTGTQMQPTVSMRRHVLVGALLGTALAVATIFQQVGLVTTTAAKSGFITALYIVIVPLLGLLGGKRIAPTVLLGVVLSLVGLYLLCIQEGFGIESGDLLTMVCALMFSIHIILIDRYGGALDSVLLSAIQFAVAAIISGLIMAFTESPTIEGILGCWKSIIYAAVFSGAIGYTFQIIGQKYTDPTLASLLMCLESVFAAIGGWIILNEGLAGREIWGCVLMFTASILALLPTKKRHVI